MTLYVSAMRFSLTKEMKSKKNQTFTDLCLEAEDGDEETDCCCDAQTQHHRLGVVETYRTSQV